MRQAYAEFERGNFWVPEFVDPDIRIRWLDVVGARAETVGLENLTRFLRDWFAAQQLTMTAERLIDAGDQVVVVAVWRGRGKASDVVTEWRHGQVWTLRDGRVTSVISYREPPSKPPGCVSSRSSQGLYRRGWWTSADAERDDHRISWSLWLFGR